MKKKKRIERLKELYTELVKLQEEIRSSNIRFPIVWEVDMEGCEGWMIFGIT
jgi:hypothetical protein